MPHVVWSRSGLADLERIYRFYAESDRKTGLRAILLLRHEVDVLELFPDLGKSAERVPYRELTIPFGRHAFFVLYHRTGPEVTIAAIRHGRENGYVLPSDTC